MVVIFLEKVENVPRMGLLTNYLHESSDDILGEPGGDPIIIEDPARGESNSGGLGIKNDTTGLVGTGCLTLGCSAGSTATGPHRSCVRMVLIHKETGAQGPPVHWDYRRGNRTPTTWYSARSITLPSNTNSSPSQLEQANGESSKNGPTNPNTSVRTRDYTLKIETIPIATSELGMDQIQNTECSVLMLNPEATTFQKYRDRALDYLGSPPPKPSCYSSDEGVRPSQILKQQQGLAVDRVPSGSSSSEQRRNLLTPDVNRTPSGVKRSHQSFAEVCRIHLWRLSISTLDHLLNERAKTVYFVRHSELL
mmetsp:Transcript_13205/g.29094  ORF Transcript_13205/g.29094 Transcript_13205/m.29094 type:complete len:308 (-) Transcript_13205:682-1605(-)